MGKYAEDAKQLLHLVGGKENIAAVSHCMTRMRFALADLKKAGADCIAIASSSKYAVISDSSHRLTFYELMEKIPHGMDIIIGEGFKDEDIPKILVYRKEINKPNLYNIEKNIIAAATDNFEEFKDIKNVFHINDYEKICDFLINYMKK